MAHSRMRRPATRAQAVEHNLECIEIGKALGSKALTVWIGDGTNFAGQQSLTRMFERYLDAMAQIYEGLPADWTMFIEHKIYEPAFYSTVIADWGSSLMAAQTLGPQAKCLVDLGHHAPTTNIEMIVARLIHAGKLAGFHFNDSKYGDDDLDSASVDPFRLFLVFNELVDAEMRGAEGFAPAYMIDQSHNVTDPIESLMASAVEIARGLYPGEPGRPGSAGRGAGRERRAGGAPDVEGGIPHRCLADPRRSADPAGRCAGPDRHLSCGGLPGGEGEGAARSERVVFGHRLTVGPWRGGRRS